jgi:Fur family ferric uptake transcriptional regulator
VVKHNFEGGQAYYELDSGLHHDHMVCVETGKVTEFVSAEIEALQKNCRGSRCHDPNRS